MTDVSPVPRRPHPWNTGFSWTDVEVDPGDPVLTPERVADFNRAGFFLLPGVFDSGRCAAMRAAIEPAHDRVVDLLRAVPGGRLAVAGLDTQTVTPHLAPVAPALRDACADPTLLHVAHRIIGPRVRLYWEQAVNKQPHSTTPVPWHQDNGYAYVEPQNYLTCWVALCDTDRANGGIAVMAGAHTEGTLEHRWTEAGSQCWGDWATAVHVPAKEGDVVVFSSLTPHATPVNTGDEIRWAYIIQYMADGARLMEGSPPDAPRPSPLNEPRHVLFV